MMTLGEIDQATVLATLQQAEKLWELMWEHAARWRPVPWPQGWWRVAYLLVCRGLLCATATSLINFINLLGFPVYLTWVRLSLMVTHIAALAVTATIIVYGDDPDLEEAQGVRAVLAIYLTISLAAAVQRIFCDMGDKDIPGRQRAVEALRGGGGAVLALQGLPQDWPGHASLRAALQVFATRFAAVVAGDEAQLLRVQRSQEWWLSLLTSRLFR